jgi:hypothetical protein
MRYKTVQQILDQASTLHQRVATLANGAAVEQDRHRLALVLDYLADHQDRLRSAIDAFVDEAGDRVLATWFDRAPELELPDLNEASLARLEDIDELIDRVAGFHERVIALYANLRDQARIEAVQAVFADLAELERHEKMELIQGARQLQDI